MSDLKKIIVKNKKKGKLFSIEVGVLSKFESWAKENDINQSQTVENLIKDLMSRAAEDKKMA